MEQNQVLLAGSLCAPAEYSHSNHGRHFFSCFLEVERLSGALDRLRVLLPEPLLGQWAPSQGLQLLGQLRSYNQRSGQGRRLLISVLAQSIEPWEGPHANRVELTGSLCRAPVYRRTPLGREICDVMLAVNRAYHRADYLPCILWGRCAQMGAGLQVGQRLQLSGRLQSRQYIKLLGSEAQERTAYEISAISAQPAEEP